MARYDVKTKPVVTGMTRKELVEMLCEKYNLPVEQLTDKMGSRDLSYKRFWIWAELRYKYNWTYSSIGRMCDRDHTTILNGVKKSKLRSPSY